MHAGGRDLNRVLIMQIGKVFSIILTSRSLMAINSYNIGPILTARAEMDTLGLQLKACQ